jgi:transcription termination/antitermination protein NusG
MKSSWYVLQVMTGHERDVADKAARMPIITRPPLVPVRILKERSDGIWRHVRKTVFPGYVFVNAALTVRAYYDLLAIPDAIRFCGATIGGLPEPVPPEQMLPVLLLGNHGEDFGLSKAYKVGERTQIVSGPLRSLEGQIVKVDTRRGRATVSLSLFGAEHTVELGLDMIQPTNDPDNAEA